MPDENLTPKKKKTKIIIIIVVVVILIVVGVVFTFKESGTIIYDEIDRTSVVSDNVKTKIIFRWEADKHTVEKEYKGVSSDNQKKIDDLLLAMNNLYEALDATNLMVEAAAVLVNITESDDLETLLSEAQTKLYTAADALDDLGNFDNSQFNYQKTKEFGEKFSEYIEGLGKLVRELGDTFTLEKLNETAAIATEIETYSASQGTDINLEDVVEDSELKALLDENGFLVDYVLNLEDVKDHVNNTCPSLPAGEHSIFCPQGSATTI